MPEPAYNLGHLWGPFYRLTGPKGPHVVFHRHKWTGERWIDDGGAIIGTFRRCNSCATVRGTLAEEEPNV